MRSRLFLYGFTIVVIGLLAIFIVRNTYWEDVTVPMPLRGEAITNPFYAAQRLADSLGARTEWRKTLDSMPPTDAIVVLDRWNWDLIEPRRRQMEHWVEQGGRLLLDSSFFIEDKGEFQHWSGVSKEYVCAQNKKGKKHSKCEPSSKRAAKDEDEAESTDTDVDTDNEQDVGGLGASTPNDYCRELFTSQAAPGLTGPFTVCTLDEYMELHSRGEASWSLSDHDELNAVRVPVGRGSVTVINAAPFGNRDLTRVDHGLLFAAATQLRRGDLVVFLSEEKHASLLELVWDYGAPSVVLALLLLAAALWRNGARFGPPVAVTDSARRSLAEQIVGTGRFTLRFGGGKALHAAAVRALNEAASKRLPGYVRMNSEERVAQMAHMTQTDTQALAETMNYAGARNARDLKHAVDLLERVRRRLLTRNGTGDSSHAG